MSNTLKTIIIGLVVIVLIGLGWKYYIDRNYSDLGDVSVAPIEDNAKKASEADFEKDLANIDVQLEALADDSINIDQGLNDKPVPPAE